MAAHPVAPTDIDLTDANDIVFRWNDGTTSTFSAFDLRTLCPCAGCVDEWTGRRTLDPNAVSHQIRPVHMELVGRYAVRITWSDGHNTGIYSWEYVRKLSDGAAP